MVQYVREKILRRPAVSIAGEEISEKSTTKLGYFLLFCMFFAIITSAQWTLSVIKDIPSKPTAIPYCVTDVLRVFDTKSTDNSYFYSYWNSRYNCDLISAKNPEFDFTNEYNILISSSNEIKILNDEVQQYQRSLWDNSRTQSQNRDDYNTALIEEIADNWGIYDSNTLQQNIQNIDSGTEWLNKSIATARQEIAAIKSQNASAVGSLRVKFETAQEEYRMAYLVYRLYIAALSFLFSILVFTILYKMYARHKSQNSPHTVIFSVATFAYGLILLQISSLFIWDIIPKKIAQIILSFIEWFAPLIFIIQFLWPLVIIWIFGFLVYKIQKRLYSSTNILKRFISDKKCPSCGNAVHLDKPFCPLCSYEIHQNCGTCNELTLKWMPYCSNCGGKQNLKSSFYEDKKIFDTTIEGALENIDISMYESVKFIPNEWKSFTSKRKNVMCVALYLSQKLEKNTFEPNELSKYVAQFLKHIQSDIVSEKELNRILWKIHSWVASGGSLKFISKK